MIPAVALANKNAQQFSVLGNFHNSSAAIEGLRNHMSDPYRDHAKSDRANDVHSGMKQLPLLKQFQGLQAERGKCGVPPADSEHEKLPSRRTNEHSAAGISNRAEESNNQ